MSKIKELNIYPIKGCRGISVKSFPIGQFGPHLDRHWMIVDENGKFISQREEPSLAQLEVSLNERELLPQSNSILLFVNKDKFELNLNLEQSNNVHQVSLWGQSLNASLVDGDVSNAISDFLKRKVSLVQVNQQTHRKVSNKYQSIEAITAFPDGYPLLAVFSSSLNDFNSKLTSKITASRFRANILIENPDEAPYLEDYLNKIKIGNIEFSVKPCPRCTVINIDQNTGHRQKDGEPLKVLAGYRNFNGRVNFGVHLTHASVGNLSLNDSIFYLHNAG